MIANKEFPRHSGDTLQEIRDRKAETRKRIKESVNHIKASTHGLFAPPPPAPTRAGAIMDLIDKGVAVYDGFLMGMRIARNVRRIFRKRR